MYQEEEPRLVSSHSVYVSSFIRQMAKLRNVSKALLFLTLVALAATTTAAGNDDGVVDDHDSSETGPRTTTTSTEIPILEPGNERADDTEAGERVRQIKFGDKVKLDDIGPIIVNDDCSMRRIANWETLTQREKNGAQRRVAARNKRRLDHCRRLEQEGKLRRPLDAFDEFAPSAMDPRSHIEEVSVASLIADDHDEL